MNILLIISSWVRKYISNRKKKKKNDTWKNVFFVDEPSVNEVGMRMRTLDTAQMSGFGPFWFLLAVHLGFI